MKTQTKYISDCGDFVIENGRLTGVEDTDRIEDLYKFLTEYLNVNGFLAVAEAINTTEPIDPKEELFISIIEGGKWEGDYYLNKEGKKLIYNGEKDAVWVDCYLFWNKFYKQFNMNDDDIEVFMKDKLSKHLKIEGKTPLIFDAIGQVLLSKHLKIDIKTPNTNFK